MRLSEYIFLKRYHDCNDQLNGFCLILRSLFENIYSCNIITIQIFKRNIPTLKTVITTSLSMLYQNNSYLWNIFSSLRFPKTFPDVFFWRYINTSKWRQKLRITRVKTSRVVSRSGVSINITWMGEKLRDPWPSTANSCLIKIM